MNDEQPTQPLTDAELAAICEDYRGVDEYDSVPRLLAEVDRLRAALTALARNEQAAANRSLEMQEENERLRLEVVQMESGAQIAMDAGVSYLQEVKRLEKVCADLKKINDRMAEDRLRLVDERDRLITEREADADVIRQLRAEATGTTLGHLAKIERLQSQRDALVRKLGLDWGPDEFGDLSVVPDRAEQISAVVSLHQPTAMSSWGHRTCTECDTPGYYQEWPCPTLVALGFEER